MEEDEPTTSSAFVAALPAGYVLQWLLKPTQRSQLRKFARNHRLAALLDRSAVILVGLVFFNMGMTDLESAWRYGRPINIYLLPTLPASLVVIGGCLTPIWSQIAGLILLATAAVESTFVLTHQLALRGHFYLNELMVKQISLCGVTMLLLGHFHKKEIRRRPPQAEAVFQLAQKADATIRTNILLLVCRLLVALLFLSVGYHELQANAERREMLAMGLSRREDRQANGHDFSGFKMLEFGLSLFLALGLASTTVSALLALVLVIEAFVAWQWWGSHLNMGYALHARSHFAVNLAVAGGLLLLCRQGFGQYTADQLASMAKKRL